MNLLKEGIEKQLVIKTTMTRKLTIDGITQAYPVYKVRLDCLYYNDQNDRIATWISQYKSQNDGIFPVLMKGKNTIKLLKISLWKATLKQLRRLKRTLNLLISEKQVLCLLMERFCCLRCS